MSTLIRHLTRCFVAGVVALLPVGGTVVALAYFESEFADTGLKDQDFYFPGLGLLAAIAAIYLTGLVVSTWLGRWFWGFFDRLLERLPALGRLYVTLKQILGYGEGEDAMFQRVVLVPGSIGGALELGLVTNRIEDDGRLVVFVPGAPNPTLGRLALIDPSDARDAGISVSAALKALVSVGATDLTGVIAPPTPPDA
ncbi:MAG: DUF502 domain-containing protein [Planctomycetota bacterium]